MAATDTVVLLPLGGGENSGLSTRPPLAPQQGGVEAFLLPIGVDIPASLLAFLL